MAAGEASRAFAGVFGLAALLWGASTAFSCLADSLNSIWGVRRKPGRFALGGFLKHRLLAFTLVAATGAYLLFSSLVTTALATIGALVNGFLPLPLLGEGD